MEVLHSNSDKRRVLVGSWGTDARKRFYLNLEKRFHVIACESAQDVLAIMNEQFMNLSAAIVDVELASEDDFALLRELAEERCFDTIPTIVVTQREMEDRYERLFQEGVADIIELPCSELVAWHRIDNAIQLMRSATFYDIGSMLRVLPSMIFLKDAEGRYVFSTQYWHHLDTGDDPKWTIRGKTDVDIRKDRENAIAAMEADREIIRTGKGTSYVVEINADGVQDFIQLIKEPVFDDEGNVTGIIALGNNVTETELMKRKLARYALIDDLTGLGNRRAYNEFLEGFARRDDFPIAVISADCDDLKTVNDTFGHLVGDEYIRMSALVLRSTLPDEDLVFRVGGDEFMAFVPNATVDQVESYINAMKRRAELFKLSKGKVVVSFGYEIVDGCTCDVEAAISAADKRMYDEKATHKRNRP